MTVENVMTFAQSASRLSAISALLLGWRPHEFWVATPAELQVIFAEMERAREGERPPAPGDLANLMEMFPDG
jgi:hypothetical protein